MFDELIKNSLCHDVFAAFTEVVSGMRFGEYVKRNIFDVCGMENSSFRAEDIGIERIVGQYKFDAEKCGGSD